MPKSEFQKDGERALKKLFTKLIRILLQILKRSRKQLDEISGETICEFGGALDQNPSAAQNSDDGNDVLSRYDENLIENLALQTSPERILHKEDHLHSNLIRPIGYKNRSLDHENGGKEAFEPNSENRDLFRETTAELAKQGFQIEQIIDKKSEKDLEKNIKKAGERSATSNKTGSFDSDDNKSMIWLRKTVRAKIIKAISASRKTGVQSKSIFRNSSNLMSPKASFLDKEIAKKIAREVSLANNKNNNGGLGR